MDRSPTERWLLRTLTPQHAYTFIDLMRLSGFKRRALNRAMERLQNDDEVLRICDTDVSEGTLQAVFVRTHTDERVRVPDFILLRNAQSRVNAARRETIRRRARATADAIRGRVERERRKARAKKKRLAGAGQASYV